MKLSLSFPAASLHGATVGGSVAVNGVCLTITQLDEREARASFDVIDETLARSTLGGIAEGHSVNFERAACFGAEIGGHVSSGHVHCTARVEEVEREGDNVRMCLRLGDEAWAKYVLPKGFISVDGCSLTVGLVKGSAFDIHLIPETLR
ncbi:hypothetical protein H632_c1915p0 [Helicosporidium sp. ATCC 50920]|nr:hypothetical protein H632_c1915p0 [Helicosporidium sp. ATCC 50920]|eukprot:KDD73701.1 hypothetical protein H632_c1915p0 [Helicosporidium sp. ATCC 50920]